MFNTLKRFKTINTFEKIIFVVGLMIIIYGFYLFNKMVSAEHAVSWALIKGIALWSSLILILVLTDSNESIKEELKAIITEHKKETKQLRKLSAEQLQEIRLLRKVLEKR